MNLYKVKALKDRLTKDCYNHVKRGVYLKTLPFYAQIIRFTTAK